MNYKMPDKDVESSHCQEACGSIQRLTYQIPILRGYTWIRNLDVSELLNFFIKKNPKYADTYLRKDEGYKKCETVVGHQ